MVKTTTSCYGTLHTDAKPPKYMHDDVLKTECEHVEINFHPECFTLQNAWDMCSIYMESIAYLFSVECDWSILTVEPKGRTSELPDRFLLEQGPLVFERSEGEKQRLAQFYIYKNGIFEPSFAESKQIAEARVKAFPSLEDYAIQQSRNTAGYPRIHLLLSSVNRHKTITLPFGVYSKIFPSYASVFGVRACAPKVRGSALLSGEKIWLNAFKNSCFLPVQNFLHGRQVIGHVPEESNLQLCRFLQYFNPISEETSLDDEQLYNEVIKSIDNVVLEKKKIFTERDPKFARKIASNLLLSNKDHPLVTNNDMEMFVLKILGSYHSEFDY